MMDRAEKLLKLGRAHDPSAMVFALDDPEQAVASDTKVDPLVAGPADMLDLEAERLEDLADKLLESLPA